MNARQLLIGIAERTGDDEIGIPVVTVLELAHGLVRSNTPERRDKHHRCRGAARGPDRWRQSGKRAAAFPCRTCSSERPRWNRATRPPHIICGTSGSYRFCQSSRSDKVCRHLPMPQTGGSLRPISGCILRGDANLHAADPLRNHSIHSPEWTKENEKPGLLHEKQVPSINL
jgi:hypothetical protein